MTRAAIEAGIALLPELRRETLFLVNDKTLLLKPEIQTIIACIESAQALLVERDEAEASGIEKCELIVEHAKQDWGTDGQLVCDAVLKAIRALSTKEPANE